MCDNVYYYNKIYDQTLFFCLFSAVVCHLAPYTHTDTDTNYKYYVGIARIM